MVELSQDDIDTLIKRAYFNLLAGGYEAARQLLEEVSMRDEKNIFCHMGLAKLLMPGPGYLEILREIGAFLQPRNYVEIGVDRGFALRCFSSQVRIIGIDPCARIDEIPDNVEIYSCTSDQFFAENDLSEILGGKLELAFIDGLHHFEQSLKDFINLERFSRHDAIILIHDTLPLNRLTSSRKQNTAFWSGDVWKLIPCLKHERPDLKIRTIPAFPTGLTIVTRLDADSCRLSNNYCSLVEKYSKLNWDEITERVDFFSLVNNDRESLLNLLCQDRHRGQRQGAPR